MQSTWRPLVGSFVRLMGDFLAEYGSPPSALASIGSNK
jgi:hypothetical protein